MIATVSAPSLIPKTSFDETMDSRLVASGTDDIGVESGQIGDAGVATTDTQKASQKVDVNVLTGGVLDSVERLGDASGVVSIRGEVKRRA